MSNIPVYIISFNRVHVLKQTIRGLLNHVPYDDIIVIDNGSDYQPLLDYYPELESYGVTVIRNSKIHTPDDLNTLYTLIEPENRKRQCQYYIVCDSDISVEQVAPDFLDVMRYFLDHHPRIGIVGPMLKIIDIPKGYPAREYAWRRHRDKFWRKKPTSLQIGNRKVYYLPSVIDTTFGMVRAETTFHRFIRGVRLYDPYEARHLDWYITPETMTEDQRVYMEAQRNNTISHWGSQLALLDSYETLNNIERWIYVVENGKLKRRKLIHDQSSIKQQYLWILEAPSRVFYKTCLLFNRWYLRIIGKHAWNIMSEKEDPVAR